MSGELTPAHEFILPDQYGKPAVTVIPTDGGVRLMLPGIVTIDIPRSEARALAAWMMQHAIAQARSA